MATPHHASRITECCQHCGAALEQTVDGPFCCEGCALVYGLLHAEGLDRFYALRGNSGAPVPSVASPIDDKWLELICARVEGEELSRVDVDIQGLRCAACVWLIETLFRRQNGASISVDPGLGKARLILRRGFDLRAFVRSLQRFGYQLGPSRKVQRADDSGLLLRMGICIALAMNAMILSISVYAGLPPGPLRRLFDLLSLALATIAVLVGGSLFFSSAIEGLRRRVLHLDFPIALGIALAYGASVGAYFTGRTTATYFDTLDVFIALMLVGRWLQERVLFANRRWLLASDGVDGLLTRRVNGDGQASLVRCTQVREGDRLLLAPGDLLPVDARLDDGDDACASLSLDWINGESAPRAFRAKDTLPAGAFCANDRPLIVRAHQDFSCSTLVDLLRAPAHRDADPTRPTSAFWTAVARWYVVAVLLLGGLGFLIGWLRTRQLVSSIEVVAAVLIVTCPCAFGIAVPLAYEMVQARLRRNGLFVRTPGFLDRAAQVRRVVFDKTGTLTTGALDLDDTAPLRALAEADRAILLSLVSASSHPKSIAVARALSGTTPEPSVRVVEVPGAGMEGQCGLHHYRFGAPSFVLDDPSLAAEGAADLALARDGQLLAMLRTRESLRPDAAEEIRRLRMAGYEVHVLSGDTPTRVAELASACGLPASFARGANSAREKAAWIRSIDRHDTLMVGDGINDALALSEAWCSGTPAVDRPFVAAHADFYFVAPGLRPIRQALEASTWLAKTVRSLLVTALAYNVLTVTFACLGLMTPLACAIVMPLSSLSMILRVSLPLRRDRGVRPATRGAMLPVAPFARSEGLL